MKPVSNIAFGIIVLWISIVVTRSKQIVPSQFIYDLPADSLDFKPQTNETTLDGNGEISSTAILSVSTTVTSTSSASRSGTPSSSQSSSVSPVALNAEEIQKLSHILEQDESVSTSPKALEVTGGTTASKAETSPIEDNGTISNSTRGVSTNGTSPTSAPDVVLSTAKTKSYLDTIVKKSLSWLGDQYTLSIVGPIVGGFLFAMVIITTLAMFTCIRRRCRRRRFRKKILPEAIRKMGPSDRARLLAETSDEEF